MNVWIMDRLERIGLVTAIHSLVIELSFYGLGAFELVAAADENNLKYIKPGRVLYRETDVRIVNDAEVIKNALIVREVEVDWEEDLGYLIHVRGKTVKDILSQRIVWNQIVREDTGLASIVEAVITDNITEPDDTDREISGFTFEMPLFDPITANVQLHGENIGEWMENFCTENRQGWEVDRSGSTYTMRLLYGTDRSSTVIFSPAMDNLKSSVYINSTENYKNAALVGGEGEGIDRVTVSIEAGSPSGLARYETFIDALEVSSNNGSISESKYKLMLKTYGRTEIAQLLKTKSFEAEVDLDGVFKLGTDYFMGDTVKIIDERGITANARLVCLTYAYEESGYITTATFEIEEE